MNLYSPIVAEKSYKLTNTDCFFVFLLLFVSGNPLAIYTTDWTYVITCGFLIVYTIAKKVKLCDKRFFLVLTALCIVYIMQKFTLGRVSIAADINSVLKIYCGYLVVSILGKKFRVAYLKVMYFICVISLLGFSLNMLLGNIPGYSFDRYHTLFLYNYLDVENSIGFSYRNAGMFWEAGAFQGYINIAFLLYVDSFKEFLKQYKKYFIVLVAALITTFSTTGFIAFGIIVTIVMLKYVKRISLKFASLIFVAFISMWAYSSFDFLGEKIIAEYEESQDITNIGIASSRMGSAIISLESLMRHPICGNGYLLDTRYDISFGDFNGGGNGFFGTMNILGIPMMLLYFVLLYKNVPTSSIFLRMSFVLVVILLLQGEYFLNYPLFWSLLFIYYPEYEYEKNRHITYCT